MTKGLHEDEAMTGLRTIGIWMLSALVVSGCASEPKVTTVSESNKRPANSREAIELQSCRGDLKNTQVLLEETTKLADAASTALAGVAARCSPPKSSVQPSSHALPLADDAARIMPASLQQEPTAATSSSTIYVLLFPFGSTQIDLAEEGAIALSGAAQRAELIVIRGRTDGTMDSEGNQRVARGRAEAVRDYLTALGIDADRIRTTYQSVGDHVADNAQDAGRALNRRAEVEVYEAAPRRELLTSQGTH